MPAMTEDRRVFVHVGGPKTGTTFLQDVMWTNRAALRAAGVLYGGGSADAHFLAAQDVMGHTFHEQSDPRLDGAWDRLVAEIADGPATAVISHEVLALADEAAIERARATLDFAEVHVVYTARDLARQIPSVWQEDLKNRHTLSFGRFVRGLREDDPDPPFLSRLFWRFQDPLQVLARWGTGLPSTQVHVVTVPPPGADPQVLWQRWASTLGLDPERLHLTPPRPTNQSLGVVEANLLRQVNIQLGGREFDWPTYERWVKAVLAGGILAGRPDAVPLRLPPTEFDWARARGERLAADLAAAGYDVVGALDDLVPVPSPDDQAVRRPDHATDRELRDTALHALAELLRHLQRTTSTASRTGADRPPPAELSAAALWRLGLDRLGREHRSVALVRTAASRLRRAVARRR